MNRSYAWAGAFGTFVTVATVAYSNPGAFAELGLDFWRLPQYHLQLQRDERLHRDLTARSTLVLHGLAIKDRIARDALAGRLSLTEAAVRFRDSSHRPESARALACFYADRSPDEALCLCVLVHVRTLVQAENGDRKAPRRLEAQYDRARRSGPIRLPS